MSFGPFGSAEADDTGNAFCGAFGLVSAGSGSIVNAPALSGNLSFEIDPVNGGGFLENYGWIMPLDQPDFLTVMFLWQTPAVNFYDARVVIGELGNTLAGGAFARRLTMPADESLLIEDKDTDTIGQTAAAYVAANTLYSVLWYVDLRGPTRDILWVWKAGAWAKALDVAGHGDGDPAEIEALIFGTQAGKGLPTVGDPFHVDDIAAELNPNSATALGSAEVMFKLPSGDGTDGDFDGGSGGNPDWNNVKEIPPDGLVTYDEGNADDDQQSYEVANADGGDSPLAVRIAGAMKADAGIAAVDVKGYLYDGVARDYAAEQAAISHTAWHCPAREEVWEDVNGAPLRGTPGSEALFNSLEVGLEITDTTVPRTCQLTQAGLEYLIDGPHPLPADFPAAGAAGPLVNAIPLKSLVGQGLARG